MVAVPKAHVSTVLKELHGRFGHFEICEAYSLIKRHYFWPKMIKHIQRHIDSCFLCSREEPIAGKYQLQTTEIFFDFLQKSQLI